MPRNRSARNRGFRRNPKSFLRTDRQSTPGGSMCPEKCVFGVAMGDLGVQGGESEKPAEKWAPSWEKDRALASSHVSPSHSPSAQNGTNITPPGPAEMPQETSPTHLPLLQRKKKPMSCLWVRTGYPVTWSVPCWRHTGGRPSCSGPRCHPTQSPSPITGALPGDRRINP